MSKVANMLNLVNVLKDGKVHSIQELSDKLEISKRMIRVYKTELEQAGIYINSVRGIYGGYCLDQELNNIDIGLTIQDIKMLNKIHKKDYSKIIQKINDAYLKNEKDKDEKKLRKIGRKKEKISKIYKDFRNAINNRNKVFIKFTSVNSGKTERIIHPAELFNYLEDWYVAGFCEMRNEIRLFKLDDINEYKILDENYDENFEIKK